MSRRLRVLSVTLVCLAVGVSAAAFDLDPVDPAQPPSDSGGTPRPNSQKINKKKTRGMRGKKSAAKPDESETKEAPAAGDGTLKFSRDIAPILVANCVGCHNTAQKKGKLDLSSFDKLMQGTTAEKVLVAGKPEESHLVLRIKGEETPKMPRGANRSLSDAAIAKIEQWVKEGAVLDAGVDPKAALEKIATSPADLRKNELAKLPADQRDKQVETVGLARWKKASPKVTPQITPSAHFLLFSTLPKDRAGAATKALETQYGQIKALLGPGSVDWGEKASLFVFTNAAAFGEFVKSLENRDVEASEIGSARMAIPQPYVVVLDPLGGKEETAGPSRKAGRAKRDEDSGTVNRTLNGVLTESFVAGTAGRSGKPPRWVTLGLGAWAAAKVEAKTGYARALRSQAVELCQSWASKATDALGDSTRTEEVRVVGFAIIDWLSTVSRSDLPAFLKGMEGGGDKLDDVIGNVLNGDRELFLRTSADFIVEKYGQP